MSLKKGKFLAGALALCLLASACAGNVDEQSSSYQSQSASSTAQNSATESTSAEEKQESSDKNEGTLHEDGTLELPELP